MRRLSTIDCLPTEQRQAFIRELINRNFSDWTAITAWANQQGMKLSRSSIHRYGITLRRRMLTLETEALTAQVDIADEPADVIGLLTTLGRLEVQKNRLLKRLHEAFEQADNNGGDITPRTTRETVT